MAKTKQNKHSESEMLASIIVRGMQEKKAQDIVVLDLCEIKGSLFDYFVICHGNSPSQVEAIANSVHIQVKKDVGVNPWKTEGYENAEWIVLDYVDVIVHIFIEPARDFYKLESLWGDAEKTTYENID